MLPSRFSKDIGPSTVVDVPDEAIQDKCPQASSCAIPTLSLSYTSPKSCSLRDGSAQTLLSLKTSMKSPKTSFPITQKGKIRKRHLREKPTEGEHPEDESEPQEHGKGTRRKRKYRKGTHILRKEEIARLQKELDGLSVRMQELQKQALASFGQLGQIDKDRAIASQVLRGAVQSQQLEFANILGLMTDYALCTIEAGSPLQHFIRLSRDECSRQETLLALKPLKLDDADHFLRQRRPQVDPCKSMCEDRRYDLPNGDFCSTRFTTIQFHGTENVKQVFDILLQYFCNIEISISEKLGHITIREDDDSGDKGVTQNRLVSTTVNDLLMESNTVLFSHFFEPDKEPGHKRGRGLIVADFVNEDDRHPYRPHERVRRDITAILELTSYTRMVADIGATHEQKEESIVVLTRWVFSQLRRPSFSVSPRNWEEMRDNMDRWGETMHRTIVESLTPDGSKH